MTRWVWGMKQVGERPLDVHMSDRMFMLVCRNFQKMMWGYFFGFLGIAGIIIVGAAADAAPEGKDPIWLIPMALASALSIGIGFKYANLYHKFYQNAKRLTKTEEIQIYEDEEGNCAEVLKQSQILVSVNGTPQRQERRVTVRQTADAPPQEMNPIFPSRLRGALESGPIRERALTDLEKKQVWAYCMRYRDTQVLSPTALCTFFGLAPMLVGYLIQEPIPVFVGLGLLILSGFGWRKIFIQVRHEMDTRKDIREGVVLVIDAAHWRGPAAFPAEKYYEVLPHSKVIWRYDDKPADYRISA